MRKIRKDKRAPARCLRFANGVRRCFQLSASTEPKMTRSVFQIALSLLLALTHPRKHALTIQAFTPSPLHPMSRHCCTGHYRECRGVFQRNELVGPMNSLSPAWPSRSRSPLEVRTRPHRSRGGSNSASTALRATLWEKMAATLSQRSAERLTYPLNQAHSERDKRYIQAITFLRVGIPSLFAGLVATFVFPFLALTLASMMNDAGVFAVLSQDSSQFVQNFLTVAGLLFSILVGQTYYFMYQQQEAVYYSLFNEVTEAKSLLEQVALVCQGRSMYRQMLSYIQKYVEEDLKQLQCDPAVLLSARPVDDPLESVMYMTSVGVPSIVYETVRSLRQARAARLGALQRKLPKIHMLLLWILAGIELISFPLLGAGTQTIGGYNILTVEGCLFGIMTFGIVMTLRVVGELWRPAGGAYNVDAVLCVMVSGLEEELQARMSGKTYAADRNYPLPQFGGGGEGWGAVIPSMDATEEVGSRSEQGDMGGTPALQQQGPSAKGLIRSGKRLLLWAEKRVASRVRH